MDNCPDDDLMDNTYRKNLIYMGNESNPPQTQITATTDLVVTRRNDSDLLFLLTGMEGVVLLEPIGIRPTLSSSRLGQRGTLLRRATLRRRPDLLRRPGPTRDPPPWGPTRTVQVIPMDRHLSTIRSTGCPDLRTMMSPPPRYPPSSPPLCWHMDTVAVHPPQAAHSTLRASYPPLGLPLL